MKSEQIYQIPKFRPHPLLRGGQLQTIAGQLVKSQQLDVSSTIDIELPDGDRSTILVNEPNGDRVLGSVILFHGLGGSAQSSYCARIANKLTAHGYRVLRFNHRGAGRGGLAKAKGIYHCGSVADLLFGLKVTCQHYGDEPLSIIGFSLSGTILLNALSDHAAKIAEIPQLRAALSVCCPMQLELSSKSIMRMQNIHIDRYYTRNVIQLAEERRRLHPQVQHPKLGPKMSLRKFDAAYTAPLGGFRDRDHYYDSCSPYGKLEAVKLPTTVLQAASDPIVPASSIPRMIKNPQVIMRIEKCGGHMGFIGAKETSFGDRRWLDEFVLQWLSSY